jgi:hypothetical protein
VPLWGWAGDAPSGRFWATGSDICFSERVATMTMSSPRTPGTHNQQPMLFAEKRLPLRQNARPRRSDERSGTHAGVRFAGSFSSGADSRDLLAWPMTSQTYPRPHQASRLPGVCREDAWHGLYAPQRVSSTGVRVRDLGFVVACDVGPASWHGSGTQDPSGACW